MREWQEHEEAIRALAKSELPTLLPVGGRFWCSSDEEDDGMADYLLTNGLTLCDSGQNEIVGAKAVVFTEQAARAAIEEMQQLAREGGYRLVSVEAGDMEGGAATVLASERGYIPWWQVKG